MIREGVAPVEHRRIVIERGSCQSVAEDWRASMSKDGRRISFDSRGRPQTRRHRRAIGPSSEQQDENRLLSSLISR
jgi:hypothetical protein